MPRPAPVPRSASRPAGLARRPARRRAALGVVASALLVGGPAAGTAGAAPGPASCPKVGTTLARDTGSGLRVYRSGTALMACRREAGTPRTLRRLGTWSAATKVAAGTGDVAWTTSRAGRVGPVDAVATMDVRAGRRWFSSAHATLTPDVATPFSDDRVLRLVTGDGATAWVTAKGVVGAVVRRPRPGGLSYEAVGPEDPDLPRTPPYAVGDRVFLGDAGPAAAPAVARDLALQVGGTVQDCGGSSPSMVVVPAFGDQPPRRLVYGLQPLVVNRDAC